MPSDKDNKRDIERALKVLCNLPFDFTGVSELKLSWRQGSLCGGILKERDSELNWKKLTDMR